MKKILDEKRKFFSEEFENRAEPEFDSFEDEVLHMNRIENMEAAWAKNHEEWEKEWEKKEKNDFVLNMVYYIVPGVVCVVGTVFLFLMAKFLVKHFC